MLYLPCFHLNRVGNGNDDIASEEHFENSKTSRGSYLSIPISCFFNQILEFYLVNQSLGCGQLKIVWERGSEEKRFAWLEYKSIVLCFHVLSYQNLSNWNKPYFKFPTKKQRRTLHKAKHWDGSTTYVSSNNRTSQRTILTQRREMDLQFKGNRNLIVIVTSIVIFSYLKKANAQKLADKT